MSGQAGACSKAAGGLWEVLQARGFVAAATSKGGVLASHLQQPTKVYAGFDPTAESLHIGNLLQLMCLKHFQRAGHTPIALVGQATAMIGDPSGRSSERPVLGLEQIEHNTKMIHECVERVFNSEEGRVEGQARAEVVNNYGWLSGMGLLEFIRDYGKHFRVQHMLAKDSIKNRMASDEESERQSDGVSFTEFTYQLLQAYDFLHLYRQKGCTVQTGGSDQWGNITAGIHLIHRLCRKEAAEGEEREDVAFGLTLPLLTTSDGKKLGKSTAGAGTVWLHEAKTSAFDLYQYFINVSDDDVDRFLRLFTFLPLEDVAEVMAQHGREPHARHAQRKLAQQVTRLLHGSDGLRRAEEMTEMLFGKGKGGAADVSGPATRMQREEVVGRRLVDVACDAGLFASRGEAKRLMGSGGVYLNGQAVTDAGVTLDASDLEAGEGQWQRLVVRRGKKRHLVVEVPAE